MISFLIRYILFSFEFIRINTNPFFDFESEQKVRQLIMSMEECVWSPIYRLFSNNFWLSCVHINLLGSFFRRLLSASLSLSLPQCFFAFCVFLSLSFYFLTLPFTFTFSIALYLTSLFYFNRFSFLFLYPFILSYSSYRSNAKFSPSSCCVWSTLSCRLPLSPAPLLLYSSDFIVLTSHNNGWLYGNIALYRHCCYVGRVCLAFCQIRRIGQFGW